MKKEAASVGAVKLKSHTLIVTKTVNTPFSVKLVHALQGLNELQDLIPLPIKDQLPETKAVYFELKFKLTPEILLA